MNSVKNQALYDAVRNFCQASISHLKEVGGPIPARTHEEYVFEGNRMSQTAVQEINWPIFVIQNLSGIVELESYRVAVAEFEKDDKVKNHLHKLVHVGVASVSVDASDCLQDILFHVLKDQDGLTFDKDVLKDAYLSVEDYFYSDTVEYRCIVPLDGFEMEVDRIELGERISVIRLPDDERSKILGNSPMIGSSIRFDNVLFSKFAVEIFVKGQKLVDGGESYLTDNHPDRVAQKLADDVVLGLRLFKSGRFGFSYMLVTSTSWVPRGGGGSARGKSVPIHYRSPRYLLTRSDVEPFLSWWDKFREAHNYGSKSIDTSLRRFG